MRDASLVRGKGIDWNALTDEEFESLSPIIKNQFEDLLNFCDPVLINGVLNRINRKDLLLFLWKKRQGVGNEFLKIMFDYSSWQNVTLILLKDNQQLIYVYRGL